MKNKVVVHSTQFGLIIGEEIERTEKESILTNPGFIQAVNSEKGPQFIISKIIPPFLKNKDNLTFRFPVRRDVCFFSDEADAQLAEMYEQYAGQIVKERSGIQVVDQGFINRNLDKLKGNRRNN